MLSPSMKALPGTGARISQLGGVLLSWTQKMTDSELDLPALSAFNFVLDDVLQGGVNGSLNLDGHGKSLSFLALSMPVEVSPEVLKDARKARRAVEGGI